MIVNNCTTGFNLPAVSSLQPLLELVHKLILGQPGGIAVADAVVIDTPIFINLAEGNSTLVLNNIKLNNVETAISVSGSILLAGGTTTIESWAQGNVYSGNHANSTGTFVQGSVPAPFRPSILLDDEGRVFGKAHPQYVRVRYNTFARLIIFR